MTCVSQFLISKFILLSVIFFSPSGIQKTPPPLTFPKVLIFYNAENFNVCLLKMLREIFFLFVQRQYDRFLTRKIQFKRFPRVFVFKVSYKNRFFFSLGLKKRRGDSVIHKHFILNGGKQNNVKSELCYVCSKISPPVAFSGEEFTPDLLLVLICLYYYIPSSCT